MTRLFNALWQSMLNPMLQRPRQLQVAALCHRVENGVKQVLLVTSRDTGRWIIPKGWPIRGLNASETAVQEAWEEAGVKGRAASPDPIGRYTYTKRKSSGLDVAVETLVYDVPVSALADSFPEADQRDRKWVRPDEAAEMVNERELKTILRQF